MTDQQIVCPHQSLVEVYFNADDEVVIRQEGHPSDGSGDQHIVLTRDNAVRLITHLQLVVNGVPNE